MQIFSDEDGKGASVIVLDKKEGQALLAALEYATAPKHVLAKMKPKSKASLAHKVAAEIEAKLAVY